MSGLSAIEACGLYNYRVVFRTLSLLLVEIPKAGSSTLKDALFRRAYAVSGDIPPELNNADLRAAAYPETVCTLADLSDEGLLRIALIRDPWARVASAYMNVGGQPFIRDTGASFEAFVESLPGRIATPPEDQFNNHFKPCSDFLPPPGAGRDVHVLGRLEALEAFRGAVAARGVELDLGRVNASAPYDARRLYTPALINRVGDLYAEDVRLGGYAA